MNTRQCTYLLTIAEFGYLSHAAARLDISQAALSKFLAEQERLLGVNLFIRYKKKLYPTSAGTVYLEAARQMISVKNNLLQSMGQFASGSHTTIRAISTPYRGVELFSSVYSHFLAAYPNIDLKLDEAYSAKQEALIHEGKGDFACGAGRHTDYSDVCNLPILKEEVFLTAPSFHALAKYAGTDIHHPVSLPLRMLQDTPFVLPTRRSNLRIIADELFAQNNVSPIIAFESNNSIAVDSMLKMGMGVGFTTHRYVKEGSGMVYFRLDPPCQEITYLRYRKNRTITKEERYLCGLIIRERMKLPANYLVESSDTAFFLNGLKPSSEPEEY